MAQKKLELGTIKIADGPGKFDFMLAVFDSKQVTFTIYPATKGEELQEIKVHVTLAGPEDGLNSVWTGCFKILKTHESRSFCYDSLRRTGTIHPKGEGWHFSVKNENY